jgi:hypothetical protein
MLCGVVLLERDIVGDAIFLTMQVDVHHNR